MGEKGSPYLQMGTNQLILGSLRPVYRNDEQLPKRGYITTGTWKPINF